MNRVRKYNLWCLKIFFSIRYDVTRLNVYLPYSQSMLSYSPSARSSSTLDSGESIPPPLPAVTRYSGEPAAASVVTVVDESSSGDPKLQVEETSPTVLAHFLILVGDSSATIPLVTLKTWETLGTIPYFPTAPVWPPVSLPHSGFPTLDVVNHTEQRTALTYFQLIALTMGKGEGEAGTRWAEKLCNLCNRWKWVNLEIEIQKRFSEQYTFRSYRKYWMIQTIPSTVPA